MIPQEFIQSLLVRIDIVDVVERHVPLKRTGANYSACCPFHNEKTPSFTVSQTKQFYHCFGCAAHGTAISFLMDYAGLSFVEAVADLAGQIGMTVPKEELSRARPPVTTDSAVSIDAIHEALRTAMQFFREQLKKSPAAISYLKQRGVSGEIAARFGIGYAPDGWQNLSDKFADYQSPVLLSAGLVIDSPEGRRYDRFRDRVMFPILDGKGGVIGFGGRVLGDGEPKYLNSPETPVFEKGRELYGLNQARRAIRDAGTVIVVEGYMDVVGLAQHGVDNAVATLGTATTGTHVQKLLRQASHIVFAFDGDRAGQAAAWRALQNTLPELQDKKKVSFLFLPADHDPDSFIREYGAAGFTSKLQDSLPLSEFFLRELQAGVNLRSQEGRAQLMETAKPLVQQIKAPIFSLQIRKRLAEAIGLSQFELDREYGVRPSRLGKTPFSRVSRRMPSLARRLLKCLVAEPALALTANLAGPAEPSPEGDAVPALLAFVRSAPAKVTVGALLYGFAGSIHEALLQEVHSEILAEWDDGFDLPAEFQKVVADIAALERDSDPKNEALQRKVQTEGLSALSREEKELYKQIVSTRT